jgi:hypothetical protein
VVRIDRPAGAISAAPIPCATRAATIDWAEARFRELGRDGARELALTLFAGVQGGALLANAFRDPAIMTGRVRHLEEWLDTLA